MSGFRHYPPGGGRPLGWLGRKAYYLTLGEDSGERYCLSWTDVPPGGGPRPHVQGREDEVFYLLSGELEFTAGNRTVRLGVGGLIQIRRGTAHAFRNVGPSKAEMLCLNAPAGFDRFQYAAGQPLDRIEPPTPDDLARLEKLAPDFGNDLHPPAEAFHRAPDVIVRQPGEGRSVWAAGDRYTFLLAGEDTRGDYALWHAWIPPGGGPPPHTHSREDEAFYVLEGELVCRYGGEQFTAGPGTFVNLPPGTPHQFRNESQKPARSLLLVCPAGLEQMFFETGVPAGPDDADPPPPPGGISEVAATARRYGIELLA